MSYIFIPPSSAGSEAYTNNAIASVIDSAPAALDTLRELALALDGDQNFATTVTNALAAKAPIASPTFTGGITTPAVVSSDIAGELTIAGTTTTGSLRIGGSFTTGAINIGTGTTWAGGAINIGTGAMSSGTKNINIGTGATGSTSTIVSIGSTGGSSSTIYANGTTYLNATTFVKSVENGNGNAGTINLFPSQSGGTVTLANGTSFAGTLNIGAGTLSSGTRTINIGTGSMSGGASQTITIGNGNQPLNLAGSVNVTAGSMSVGTILSSTAGAGNLFNNVTGAVDIAAGAATSIAIGRGLTTGDINIAGSTSFSGSANIASGATTSGTKVVRLGAGGGVGSTTQVHVGSNLGTSTTNLYGKVVINDGASHVPASATATGTAGQVAWDANYIYVCTATNTWVRAALSTW